MNRILAAIAATMRAVRRNPPPVGVDDAVGELGYRPQHATSRRRGDNRAWRGVHTRRGIRARDAGGHVRGPGARPDPRIERTCELSAAEMRALAGAR